MTIHTESTDKRVAGWKEAYKRGIAGDLCDVIVTRRDAPAALVALVFQGAAYAQPEPPLPREPTDSSGLTPRQLDVLDGAARGKTDGEIARRLFISVNTVKSHKKGILKTLGAANTAHAVWIAARRGIV